MAAQSSEPRLLSLTIKDVEDVEWYLSMADSEVGGLRSISMDPQGGTSTRVVDRVTDRMLRQALRVRRIEAIRAHVPVLDWAILSAYHAPLVARARVDLARSGVATAEHAMRLCGVIPLTPTAQAQGRLVANEERLADRRRRAGVKLAVVGGTEAPWTRGPERHAGRDVTPSNWFGWRSKADRAWMVAAFTELVHRAVQGSVGTGELSPAQVREGAVKALERADRPGARDEDFLRTARWEALQMYSFASNAYVMARRDVRGRDGEEAREERARKWRAVQECTEAAELCEALEISTRSVRG